MSAFRYFDTTQAELLIAQLEAERAARPRRVIRAYRIEEKDRHPQHLLICTDCFRSLREPTRAYLEGDAPHAMSCDWCQCLNVK